jgi:hypothetical protein
MKYTIVVTKRMKNNNAYIEFQSNSKRARIEVYLANLPIDYCLKNKKYDYHHSNRN